MAKTSTAGNKKRTPARATAKKTGSSPRRPAHQRRSRTADDRAAGKTDDEFAALLADTATHRRLLEFINGARSPYDLVVAPNDRIAVAEDFHHSDHGEHTRAAHRGARLMELDEARRVLELRDRNRPIGRFGDLRDLLEIDRRLVDLFRDVWWRFGSASYGRWDLLYDISVGGVDFEIEHAALLRTGDVVFLADGTNMLFWDPSDETDPQYTLRTGEQSGLTTNLLCGGHSFLADGTLLVVGGGGFGPGTPTSNQGWKLDPETTNWTRTAGDMATLRWYPTVLTLGHEQGPTGASGQALIAGGHSAGGPTMEVYSEANDAFQTVTVAGPVDKQFPQTYPSLSLLPGGEVFYTPTGFGNCGTGSVYSLNDPAAYFTFTGPAAGSWTDVDAPMNRTKGMTALVLQATYPYVRVLVVGGGPAATQSTVQSINLSTFAPSWSAPVSIPDALSRVNVATVLLPDGTILITGGTQAAPHTSWIYDPSAAVSPWKQMDALNSPRHYHSCLLLLPSGKVMAAGGAAPGGCSASVENTIEVFSPPYLFDPDGSPATRPVISEIDGVVPTKLVAPTVHHGDEFVVSCADATDIRSVVLVRPMAVTHQTDTEQRLLECPFHQTGPDELTATAPDGGHPHSLAPRGYYMLFVLNAAGTPSEAAFVHLH